MGDRDEVLSRRAKLIAAALAATGVAVSSGGPVPDDAPPEAWAQPLPPRPGVCLSIAYDPTDGAEAAEARGDLATALQIRRRLYAETRESSRALPIGRICRKMNDYVCARDAYREALRGYARGDSPSVPQGTVEAALAEVESHLGKAVVLASAGVLSATLDGKPIPTATLTEPRDLEVGRHVLALTYASGVTERTFQVQAGQATEVVVEVSTSAPPRAGQGPPVLVEEAPPPPRARPGCGCEVVGKR